ncbi:sortilin [Scleropages formosus]|uniref:sortilin n=1 Tax=Scleropages formosus TaxID=113540 RepID=UPI0010FABEA4|nr:sortilin-like [Scleropages formosus]
MTGRLLLLAQVCFFLAAAGATGRSCRGKQATFRRTHRDEAQQRTGVSRVQRDVTPRSSITCHLALAEQERKVLDDNTHETAFHGDDGSTFTLSWVGDGTGVILVLSTVNVPSGFNFEGRSSRLYRSGDYGKTFHDISSVMNNRFVKQEFGIVTGPGNSHQVILTVDVPVSEENGGVIFSSVDAGMSFKEVQLPFHPSQPISFHFSNASYLVAIGTDSAMWLSTDFGNSWRKVHEGVQSYMWGPGITLFLSSSPRGTVDADRRGELLLRRSQDLGETFTTIAQRIFSFGYIGGFLFTSVMEKLGEPRIIYVSSNLGDSFNRAQLPSATKEQFYSVLDGDEDMIFMHVDDPGDTNFGTIYTSDDRGVVYSKSLERHLFGAEGKSDFTNITSLRGVYLTNVLEKDGRIRTVISFDRGGEWRLLNKPNNTECGHNIKKCNLHIHGEYSHVKGLAPVLPLSDPSAVGLIIAHGSLGDSITSVPPDVYVSSDGGYTWTRTLRGSHHYAILDSGGLLVAVEARGDRLVSVVKFSTDEGQCWKIYNFTEQPIFLAGLASEPGTKTLNISIWGYRTEENFKTTWVTVTIDFEHLLTRECEDEDYEEWLAHSDMGLDSETRGCILGYRETFKRLKKLSVCRNGRNYVVAREESPCLCTREDYLCDYGYYRHENSSECVEQLDFRDQALDVCLNGEENEIVTSGYRKIPGDRCKGGFTPPRRMKTVGKHCGKLKADPLESETVIVLAVVCVAAVTVLITAMLLIAKKMLCTRRIPEYRFSALQLQEDDECITVGPLPVVNGNGQSYHGDSDSDEDLIE